MKNVNELRSALSAVFVELRSNKLTPLEAAELANIAGKMIRSAKVQLEYYALTKETPYIAFLESPDNKKRNVKTQRK